MAQAWAENRESQSDSVTAMFRASDERRSESSTSGMQENSGRKKKRPLLKSLSDRALQLKNIPVALTKQLSGPHSNKQNCMLKSYRTCFVINIPSLPGFSAPVPENVSIQRSISLETSRSEDDGRICRICWVGEEVERCVQPCTCSGSSAHVHSSCLVRWLQTSNSSHCEICSFQYHTQRKMKPVAQWSFRPVKGRNLTQLEAMFLLVAVVTPPLLCGIILCTQKIAEYLESPENSWKIAGLLSLVFVSVVTYGFTLVYFILKLVTVCRMWITSNQTVVIDLAPPNAPAPPSFAKPDVFTVAVGS